VVLLKKKLIIILGWVFSIVFIYGLVASEPSVNVMVQDTEAKVTKEEAMKNLLVDILSGYTTEPLEKHYGKKLPYQLEAAEITDTKMIYGKDGLYYIVKLKVQPFVGAHNPVGTDLFTFKVENTKEGIKVTLQKYDHLESFDIPPDL
jgi:hypothetical protein